MYRGAVDLGGPIMVCEHKHETIKDAFLCTADCVTKGCDKGRGEIASVCRVDNAFFTVDETAEMRKVVFEYKEQTGLGIPMQKERMGPWNASN